MNRFIIGSCVLMLFACTSRLDSEFEKIENFIKKQEFPRDLDSFSEIIVINDKGSCIQCNNDFARLISSKLEDKTTLFIISQDGTKVDISFYLENTNGENILFDFNEEFSKLNIVNGCAIMKLSEKSLGKKTIINTKNIQNVQQHYNLE